MGNDGNFVRIIWKDPHTLLPTVDGREEVLHHRGVLDYNLRRI